MSSFPFSLEEPINKRDSISEETSHSPSEITSVNAQNASSTSPAQSKVGVDSNKSPSAEIALVKEIQAPQVSQEANSSESQHNSLEEVSASNTTENRLVDDTETIEPNPEVQNPRLSENNASLFKSTVSKDEESKIISPSTLNHSEAQELEKPPILPFTTPKDKPAIENSSESLPSNVAAPGVVTSPQSNPSLSVGAPNNLKSEALPSAAADSTSQEISGTHLTENFSDLSSTRPISVENNSETFSEKPIAEATIRRSTANADDNDTHERQDVEMKDSSDKEALVDESGNPTNTAGTAHRKDVSTEANPINTPAADEKNTHSLPVSTSDSHQSSEKVENTDVEMIEISNNATHSSIPSKTDQTNDESQENSDLPASLDSQDKLHDKNNTDTQSSEHVPVSEVEQQDTEARREEAEDVNELPLKNKENTDASGDNETSKDADTTSIPSAVDIQKLLASLAPPPGSTSDSNKKEEPPTAEANASEKSGDASDSGKEISEPAPEFININEFVSNKDKGKGGNNDKNKAFNNFLQDEKDYISSGHWDRFPSGSRLFVGNLSSEPVSKKFIFETFSPYGRIAQISIKSGYGFVQFFDASACNEAIRMRQGMNVYGKNIHLEVSRPQSGGKGRNESNRSGYQRSRSRSPERRDRRNRENYGRRRSPSADSSRYRGSSPPPVLRRRGQEIPECQILVEDGQMIDKNFVYYVEDLVRQRKMSVDIADYPRNASLPNILRQLATEGVVAVMFLSYRGQKQNKVSIQVFHRDREGLRKVRYDEYASVDIPIGVEIVARAKQENSMQQDIGGSASHVPAASYIPPNGFPSNGFPSQASHNPLNGLGNLDPNTIQRLLAAIQPQQPQIPPPAHQAPFHQQPPLGNDALQAIYNGSQTLQGSPSTSGQFSGYAAPVQHSASPPGPSQQVQSIMEQLANLQGQK